MPTTDVRIINQALSHIGHSIFIEDRTGDSNEVEVSNVHYDDALAYVLEDFWWGFARRFVTPGLVEDFTALETAHKWDYSYRYPTDTVTIRGIVSNPALLTMTPGGLAMSTGLMMTNQDEWEVGSDDSGRLLYTNRLDPVFEVTKLITDPALFTAMFAEALSWRLAFLMVPGLAKDKGIVGNCLKFYDMMIQNAQAKDANESFSSPTQHESEAMRARV